MRASRDPTLISLQGIVIDETRNMLTVQSANRIRKVVKEGTTFEFELAAERWVTIHGRELVGRPEDRVRRLR